MSECAPSVFLSPFPRIFRYVACTLYRIEQRVLIKEQVFLRSYDSAPRPPPPPVSKLDRQHTGRLRKRDNLLTRDWGGRGGGVESYAKSLVLYKSFNTLWYRSRARNNIGESLFSKMLLRIHIDTFIATSQVIFGQELNFMRENVLYVSSSRNILT